ncbi:MAG TPA: hypothetical protein VLJ61_00675, partial [Pyrinomonadaceae bacterium]|nr:hypothetical protein [Pyrinomonadaceae bacterium]
MSEPLEQSAAEAEEVSPQGRAKRRRETRRLRRAEVIYAAGLAAFAVLAVLAKANSYFSWDKTVANAVQSITLPGMETAMQVVSLMGNGFTSWAIFIATFAVFFAFRRRS